MAVGSSFVYYDPRSVPVNSQFLPMPGATINFYYTGTLEPAPVYADAGLINQFPPVELEADAMGRFPVIYMDSTVQYRRQLYDQNGILQDDTDPLNTPAVGVIYAAVKQFSTIVTTGASSGISPDPELSIVIPSGSYIIQAAIRYATPSTSGLQCGIGVANVGNYFTGGIVYNGVSSNNTAGQTFGQFILPPEPIVWDTGVSNYTGYISISGAATFLIEDTLSFSFGGFAASTLGVTVQASSSLILQKIA